MSAGSDRLAALLEYVKANSRVCPQPMKWNELWKMLPSKRLPDGSWDPPLPIILGGWWSTPALPKMLVLWEQIEYAAAHGVLDQVDRYLRSLPEKDWHHIGD